MNGTDIIFTTKPNTLKTKLVKKLDGSERVEVEPYYIFLPSYRIRVGMDRVYETLANTENALSMKLVEAGKREEFLNNVGWVWEPHAHWSTTCSIENGYRKVCLGEYESEVTQSIRKGLTDFLLSFSIFLQTAGANNSHVSIGKEYWALWLGKNEYNKAITL